MKKFKCWQILHIAVVMRAGLRSCLLLSGHLINLNIYGVP